MKAVRNNVLVKRVFTKKTSLIIANLDGTPSADEFDIVTTIEGLGDECPKEEIKVGDVIHLNIYASPKRVEKVTKEDKLVVNLCIYAYDDIVGKE